MSDHLIEGWPFGPTSTLYMNGNSVYHVRHYGKPGIVASVDMRPEQAEAIREVIEERIREAQAEALEAAAFAFTGDFITGDYNSTPQQVSEFLTARAAAIRAGGS